jgi:hypothetical protein
LYRIDPVLWSQLKFEKYGPRQAEIKTPEEIAIKNDLERASEAYSKAKKITHLPPNHEAVKYLRGRKIPSEYLEEFRWVPNFQAWTNELMPGKFSPESMRYEHGRVIIPFFTREKKLFAYQGRSLEPDGVRYISINLDDSHAMIYNLEKVDFSQTIYALEGPLDSTFLSNSVAIAGANFSSLTKHLPSVKLVVCYDNEPRSPHLKEKILKAISAGFSVVIWPPGLKPKDINEMVSDGYSPSQIETILLENTYSGMMAQARLAFWSKV